MSKQEESSVEISIVKVEGLTKPASDLIEKISLAFGVVFRPWQIRRDANAKADETRINAIAEVDAERIRALGQIEPDEVKRRALRRFVAEQTRMQENIESITAKALPLLNDSADAERVENDWIVNFFDKCRLISVDEMQLLWAKILAGEANAPGRFSKRTIDTLSSIDASDATQFTRFCGACWKYEDELFPIVVEIGSPLYRNNGISDEMLFHLGQIGLITCAARLDSYGRGDNPKPLHVKYFNELFILELSPGLNNELPVGRVIFTKVGMQLASLCDAAQPVPEFRDRAIALWNQMGVAVLPADGNSDKDLPAAHN